MLRYEVLVSLWGEQKGEIGGFNVADTLVVVVTIVTFDKETDLLFETAGQIIVVEQNAVLPRLAPALDLASGCG